ncbi:MAG: lysophospholipase, partial [Pseudomonadota bacterium]
NNWGWSVESYDQRGHGHSEGPRGGLAQHDDLLRDLGAVVQVVRHEATTGPVVLMGHSLGGLVVGGYAAGLTESRVASWLLPVDGVVMVSPALEAPLTLLQRGLMLTVGRLFLDMTVSTGFDPVLISRDPAVVQAYRDDPLIHDRISPRLARFILDEGAATLERAHRWNTPTLVVYAGADGIVHPQGSAKFVRAAPQNFVCGHAFPGLAHEILNEPEQAEVFAVLKPWLEAQLFAWQCAQSRNLTAA